MSTVDQDILATISERSTREQITTFAQANFAELLESLMNMGDVSRSVRTKLRDNFSSFDALLKLSQLRWKSIGSTASATLLSGFLYIALQRSIRQVEETQGRSEACLNAIIDKLRACNDLGIVLHSRCTNSRASSKHVDERLGEAYRLLLTFIGSIVSNLESRQIVSLDDPLWKEVEFHEKKCTDYLKESSAFLFNQQQIEATTALDSQPTTYCLPRQPVRFYGREKILEEIKTNLTDCPSLTLRGIPGVGKTSSALQYAYQSLSEYNIILWMTCEPTNALDQSCEEALRRLGIIPEGQRQIIENRNIWRSFLSTTPLRWLAIFDNVESIEDLDHFWVTSPNGKILITTRKLYVGFSWTEKEMSIDPFTPAEGCGCVESLLSWSGHALSDPESANELHEELGGLPLGIVQMTAIVRTRRQPLKTFLRDYKLNKSKFHSKDADLSGIYPQQKPTIGANWLTLFDNLNNDAKSLLGILSLISASEIPQGLFNHWDNPSRRRTHGLLDFCGDSDDFFEVEEQLSSLALIDKDPDTQMLSLHRLEQTQFEYYSTAHARQEAFNQAAKLLYDVFPCEHVGQRFTGRWDDCALYSRHAIVLNTNYLKRDRKLAKLIACPEFAKLMSWCAWYLWELADYPNFQLILEGGLAACKDIPSGEVDASTLAFLEYNAGTVQTSVGDFRAAERSLTSSLERRRNLSPVNDDDLTATLNNLAMLYCSMWKFDVARERWTEAEQIHLRRPESDDRNLSLTMVRHNLQRNAILCEQNLPNVADCQQIIDTFKLTKSWWMIGHAYLVLGNLHLKLKQYQEAIEAFTTGRDTLSAPNRAGAQPATAMLIYKLGVACYWHAMFNEAAHQFRLSIAISQKHPILMEQARTQFMLVQALKSGADPITPDEQSVAESAVDNLTKEHEKTVGKNDETSIDMYDVVQAFDRCITAKYQ